MGKKKKQRVEFRTNRAKPPRANDLTRQFADDADKAGDAVSGERVRAKGDLSRHRTVVVPDDPGDLQRGRILRVMGLYSDVQLEDGRTVRCTVRRVLRSLSTEERFAVTTGDRVWIRPPAATDQEGVIERVDPRKGVLTRASRRREHVLVANVDQVAIVVSLVQPDLKPHLIDRYLAAAEKGGLAPILCLNKIDLADPVELQPLVGAYSQLGIPTLLTSAATGRGLDRLRQLLRGRATVFSGQSGVGKSSLLNAVEPGLALRVKAVSEVNSKGKHTTTTAELIPLAAGGWVVDTPGVRTLALWDTRPEEVEGYFREFRPYVPLCKFPDCTHVHEVGCAVLAAVRRRQVSDRRYHSYIGMFNGMTE
jgi:ribosome biogenesis GTPase / thiamine phosphate phosphatase